MGVCDDAEGAVKGCRAGGGLGADDEVEGTLQSGARFFGIGGRREEDGQGGAARSLPVVTGSGKPELLPSPRLRKSSPPERWKQVIPEAAFLPPPHRGDRRAGAVHWALAQRPGGALACRSRVDPRGAHRIRGGWRCRHTWRVHGGKEGPTGKALSPLHARDGCRVREQVKRPGR